MPYFSSFFVNSIFKFFAFAILKFINGILYSSMWKDITHFLK